MDKILTQILSEKNQQSEETTIIRGGVIIVGSLLWQESGEVHKYNPKLGKVEAKEDSSLRLRWRKDNLKLDEKIPIQFPLSYGRTSKPSKGETEPIITMTVSRNYELGRAFLVPFKEPLCIISSREIPKQKDEAASSVFNKLKIQAQELAKAEGMTEYGRGQRLAMSWGIISVLFNLNQKVDSQDNSDLVKAKREVLVKTQREAKCAWLSPGDTIASNMYDGEGKLNWWWTSRQGMVDSEGFLTVLPDDQWLQVEEPITTERNIPYVAERCEAEKKLLQDQLNQFDVILCTLTVPDENPPSSDEITRSIISDKSRRYFINNYRNGIRTGKDRELARAAVRKIEYVDINAGTCIWHSSRTCITYEVIEGVDCHPSHGDILNDLDFHWQLRFYDLRLQIWENEYENGGIPISDSTHRIVSNWRASIDNSMLEYKGKNVEDGKKICFQQDGNLVIYGSDIGFDPYNDLMRDQFLKHDNPVWSTRTHRNKDDEPPRTMRFYLNGTLEIRADDKPLWNTSWSLEEQRRKIAELHSNNPHL